MGLSKFRGARWLWPAVLLALLVAGHAVWLRAMGNFLVKADAPFKAEMVVVLAGDDTGLRVLKAAELVRDGYAPRILVSGPECCYGQRESDLAIAFAVKNGYPAEWFIPFPIDGRSTREEAELVMQELRRRNVGRFLVVTSTYHTRRAGRIYRALAPRDSFRVVAAPARFFRPDDWWRTRTGQREAFLEWTKTLVNWVGY